MKTLLDKAFDEMAENRKREVDFDTVRRKEYLARVSMAFLMGRFDVVESLCSEREKELV
jgi:hypothetical protein